MPNSSKCLNPLFKVGAVKQVMMILANSLLSQSPFQSRGGQTIKHKSGVVEVKSQSPFQSRGGQTAAPRDCGVGDGGLNPLFKVGAVKLVEEDEKGRTNVSIPFSKSGRSNEWIEEDD